MLSSPNADRLYVIGVQERSAAPDSSEITFLTTKGELRARARMRRGMRQAVILLSGDGRESGGEPILQQLDAELALRGIGSVRIDCRRPGDCAQCAIDVLLICQYLDDEGIRDVAIVGWSFGASVAAAAASVARNVRAVAAISAREATENCCRRLRSKPLLVLHGEEDGITPVEYVRRFCDPADGLRRLIVYPGAGHDLKDARQQVCSDLIEWLDCALDLKHACNPLEQPVG